MKNKPLRILFDASPLINGSLSGIGYYTKGVVEALAATYPDDVELVGHCFNFLGRKPTASLPVAENIRYSQSKLLPGKTLSLLRKAGLQIPFDLLIKQRGDIALFPNFVSLPVIQDIPSVVIVHDLSFIDCPEFVQAKNRAFLQKFVPPSLKKADAVFAISQATKDSAVQHYKLDAGKITVAHIPVAPMPASQPQPKLVKGKYILFVSTLEPRKNFMTLVRAYCDLPATLKKEYSLVLAGGEGWYVQDDITSIKSLQAKGENIILAGYVDENTRAGLYQHASLFVMPSHYEGFGMPLLEAMASKIPLLVSDIPVFREVAGEAALFADPASPKDFSAAMQRVLESPQLQKELVKQGSRRVQEFSWSDVARKMYEVFSELTK